MKPCIVFGEERTITPTALWSGGTHGGSPPFCYDGGDCIEPPRRFSILEKVHPGARWVDTTTPRGCCTKKTDRTWVFISPTCLAENSLASYCAGINYYIPRGDQGGLQHVEYPHHICLSRAGTKPVS